MKKSDIEIMAPAGSYESLMAAIQAGTNSVYFGLNKLNMRTRSSVNFTEEDLDRIIQICQEHNVKTYLTLNIVVYNNEIGQVHKLIDLAKEKGISAIIASDLAAIHYAKSIGVEAHISTQLNISNIEALKFYADYADVIVLARELNLDQVKEINQLIEHEQIKGPGGELVKTEMFIHGALCMSISGKCYLSLHEKNYSANRGACLQNCRKGYTVTEKESGKELDIENEYIMSPKDLCTIHFLNKILDSGVCVLKIEGRARPPEYVYTVVQCYREAIDSYFEGTFNKKSIEKWMDRLETVFNRGFWDGYYLGQKLGEWSHVYGSKATRRKIYVGKGLNYFSRKKVAEFLCEASELNVDDEILITGPTTGVIQTRANEIRVNLKNVKGTIKGDKFSIPLDQMVRRSDKLYKIVNATEINTQASNDALR